MPKKPKGISKRDIDAWVVDDRSTIELIEELLHEGKYAKEETI